jgi:predicted nucleotidyltransferase
MKPFVTGSRAYGEPKHDSDIDLVVRMDGLVLSQLKKFTDQEGILRFGRLNIIPAVSDKAYQVWKEGTEELMDRSYVKPVTRDEAVEFFKAKRKAAGLDNAEDSRKEDEK